MNLTLMEFLVFVLKKMFIKRIIMGIQFFTVSQIYNVRYFSVKITDLYLPNLHRV